jgi:hypothetical protein
MICFVCFFFVIVLLAYELLLLSDVCVCDVHVCIYHHITLLYVYIYIIDTFCILQLKVDLSWPIVGWSQIDWGYTGDWHACGVPLFIFQNCVQPWLSDFPVFISGHTSIYGCVVSSEKWKWKWLLRKRFKKSGTGCIAYMYDCICTIYCTRPRYLHAEDWLLQDMYAACRSASIHHLHPAPMAKDTALFGNLQYRAAKWPSYSSYILYPWHLKCRFSPFFPLEIFPQILLQWQQLQQAFMSLTT